MMSIECLYCGQEEFKVDKLYTLDNSDYGATDNLVTAGTYKTRPQDNVHPYAHVCKNCGYIMFFDTDKTKE